MKYIVVMDFIDPHIYGIKKQIGDKKSMINPITKGLVIRRGNRLLELKVKAIKSGGG